MTNTQALTTTPNPNEFAIMREQAQSLVKTGFLPNAIKTPEQALAIILTGRELGIPAMAALNTINVIQGKPTVSPQLMLALIERSGQLEDIQIEATETGATVTMKRKGRSAHSETFGATEAQRLGLLSKDNYKKQAAVMYRWRAVASCARVVFPDVILGLYTPDEMGATVNEDGEIVTEPTAPIQLVPEMTDAERGYSENCRQALHAIHKNLKTLNELGCEPKWTPTILGEFCAFWCGEGDVDRLDLNDLERVEQMLSAMIQLIEEENADPNTVCFDWKAA